ncbi:21215_t:CDS:2 [Dentiscutata erythropus]|uniref:21215_t:CDS:1 n=1 Tax=Dentiscutata erythropus TaxID=1348616 RepID=A0A9N8W5Z6_9GLOM|nr:21215_t:CDS:2 [Dentiscutata erythropus]
MIDSDSNDDNSKNNSDGSRGHKLTSKRRASSVDSFTPQAASPISPVKTLDTKIIQDLLVSSALNVADSAKMPSDSTHHPPLNIKLLGDNFRKFVQKCGFIFAIQDFAEDIFMWKNPSDTLLAMVIYVYICLYPQLLILVPLIAFLAILIYNFPKDSQTKKKNRIFEQFSRLNNYLPAENSVDYLKNMQNIQNLMGLISDGYDVAIDLLKHFDWSNESEALLITQVVIVILAFTSLIVWIVPWKYVFITGGLGVFIANTQFMKALIKEMSPFIMQNAKTFTKQWENYFNSDDSENSGNDGETDSSIENNWINLSQDEIDTGVGSSSKT